MGIRFVCHECQHSMNVKQSLGGKRGKCPECGVRFRIPTTNSEQSQSLPLQNGSDPNARPDEQPAPQPSVSHPPMEQDDSSLHSILSADPDAVWYVRPPSGGQYGPAPGMLLEDWIQQGRVGPSALIWRDGWVQWRTATDVFPNLNPLPDQPISAHVRKNSETRSLTDRKTGRKKSKKQRNTAITVLVGLCFLLTGTLVFVLFQGPSKVNLPQSNSSPSGSTDRQNNP